MKKRVYILSLIGLVIDIVSKIFMISKLPLGKSKVIIDGFFSFTMVHNTGGAFGMLSNNSVALAIVGIIFTGIFIYVIEKNKLSMLEEISCSLILSGILGNIIDRVLRGYVIDFIDFKIFGYDYPVFNFADICIVLGVILMIFISIRESIWKKKTKKD